MNTVRWTLFETGLGYGSHLDFFQNMGRQMQKGSTAVDPTQDWEATEAVGFFTIYNVYSRMYSNIKLHT